MSLRVLHILDHGIPQQSGYTFRTLSNMCERRKRGRKTLHLTTRKPVELDKAIVLGFADSLDGYDGLDLLIEAARRMVPRHPALRLLLVGRSPLEGNLKEQVRQVGLRDRVTFAGRVPHVEMQRCDDLIVVVAYRRLPIRLAESVAPLNPL